MDKVQMLKAWMETFPYWRQSQWGIDLSGCTPVSCHLALEDERLIGRKEDILGTRHRQLQTRFSFTRVSYGEEEPGWWIGEFAGWVRCQSEDAVAPSFGEGNTLFHLEKAKLEILGDKAVYTVKLIGTYEELYEVI